MYTPSTTLVILGSIFIGLAVTGSLIIAQDIIRRRGWRSMMGIMIPVYLLNALYLAPLTLWTYYRYGRPAEPAMKQGEAECATSRTTFGKDPHGAAESSSRPMFATVTVAVCHCGAGCLLGDIVGEWIVYATDATIRGHHLWVSFLLDYGFALSFGIIFQYFSIAPMTKDYGPVTMWRAAKADFLSLTAFQVGLYGWMAIYQVAIWDFKLGMDNVVYWWMMQIGMFMGHWTAVPMNWLLIKYKVKEPCA